VGNAILNKGLFYFPFLLKLLLLIDRRDLHKKECMYTHYLRHQSIPHSATTAQATNDFVVGRLSCGHLQSAERLIVAHSSMQEHKA
jgi:hypothetical protein